MQQRAPAQRLAAGELVGQRLGRAALARAVAWRRSPSPSSPRAGPRASVSSTVRSSTSSVCPYTSRWWKRFCSTPRSASSSGSTTAVAPSSCSSSRPARAPRGGDDPAQLREHALGRDAAQAPAPAPARAAQRVSASAAKSSSTATRTRRSTRSGSSANAPRPGHAQAASARGRQPAERVDRGAARERLGDRVDREVAQREVLLDGCALAAAPRRAARSGRGPLPARSRTPPRARSRPRVRAAVDDRARRRRGVALDDHVEVGGLAARAGGRAPRRPRAMPAWPPSACAGRLQRGAHRVGYGSRRRDGRRAARAR